MNLLSLAMVFLLMVYGSYEHWRLMRNEGRVNGTFREYLFSQYPGHTYATYFALMVASWLAALSGAGDYLNPMLIPSKIHGLTVDAQFAAAFTAAVGASIAAGYAFDSRFNKGSDPAEPKKEGEK